MARRTRRQRFARNVARNTYYDLLPHEGRRGSAYYAHKDRKRAEANPRLYRSIYTRKGKPRKKQSKLLGWLFG